MLMKRMGWYVGLTALALSAGCAHPDRGTCLKTETVTQYHPTEVYLGGGAGYSHEVVAADEPVCTRWEYPEGRPKG